MSEDFIQWVIEDQFIAGRPRWEQVGVEIVSSVEPYEEAKIRLLNASHSCIAWAGTLAGHRYIHEGARDPRVRSIAQAYATDAAIPLLLPSPLDLHAYRDSVLDRFGNAAILDTNQRVVSDSFAKIPAFIAPTVRESLERQRPLKPVAALAGLFTSFLQRWDGGRLPFEYQDQAMDAAAARATFRAPDPAAALARSQALWGTAAASADWVEAVRAAHAQVKNEFG
jgi:D-arabinitol 4-dehydrogenase